MSYPDPSDYKKYDFSGTAQSAADYSRIWGSTRSWKARFVIVLPPLIVLVIIVATLYRG